MSYLTLPRMVRPRLIKLHWCLHSSWDADTFLDSCSFMSALMFYSVWSDRKHHLAVRICSIPEHILLTFLDICSAGSLHNLLLSTGVFPILHWEQSVQALCWRGEQDGLAQKRYAEPAQLFRFRNDTELCGGIRNDLTSLFRVSFYDGLSINMSPFLWAVIDWATL